MPRNRACLDTLHKTHSLFFQPKTVVRRNIFTNRAAACFMTTLVVVSLRVDASLRKHARQEPGVPPPFYFYVYDGPDFGILQACAPTMADKISAIRQYKHGNDVLFLEQIEKHPWRVFDPKHARLFIVPFPITFIARFKPTCNGKNWTQLTEALAKQLAQEPTFIKYGGRDHLWIGSHFRAAQLRNSMPPDSDFHHVTSMCIYAGHGENGLFCAKQKLILIPYATHEYNSDSLSKAFRKHRSRPIQVYARQQIDSRKSYRLRVSIGNQLCNQTTRTHTTPSLYVSSNYYSPSICRLPVGDYTSCVGSPHLCNCCETKQSKPSEMVDEYLLSKFCLVIRGDTCRTSRLYEAVKYGCVPVIVSDELYVKGFPFEDVVHWNTFTIRVHEQVMLANKFVEHLEHALASSMDHYDSIIRNLEKFAPSLIWDHPESQVTNYVLKYAARHASSMY